MRECERCCASHYSCSSDRERRSDRSARAIENVVPIAVPEGAGYRIYNPTRYRQCSSYVDDRFGLVDEKRQTAGSVFKRITEIAYRKLLQ